jgi:predicted nuclease with TOPRIM domain
MKVDITGVEMIESQMHVSDAPHSSADEELMHLRKKCEKLQELLEDKTSIISRLRIRNAELQSKLSLKEETRIYQIQLLAERNNDLEKQIEALTMRTNS